MANPLVAVTPWQETSGVCACCGNKSKTIWGSLDVDSTAIAIYYVQWTVGSIEHDANVDIVMGAWGEGTTPDQRVLASLLFRRADGGSFMVINGEGRPADNRKLCSRALRREEIVGLPLAQEVFALTDAIWLGDARISDLTQI